MPASVDLAALDLLPYGVIVVDDQGVVRFYNRREEQIAGRKRENVIGRNFFTEVAPCTAVADFEGRWRASMADAVPAEFAFRFPFPQRAREVDIGLSPFAGGDGRRLCLITVRDLTEERELRGHLARVDRMRTAAAAAAGAAHNFNNVLAAILGSAEMLAIEPLGPRQREWLQRIMTAAEDGIALVNRLRDLTREAPIADDVPALAPVAPAVEEAVNLAELYARARADAGAARPTISFAVEEGLAPVRMPPNELREALLNLLRNAVDACALGGDIRVEAARERAMLAITVHDRGHGMDGATLARLFTPLFTTKGDEGTGLGLAATWMAVRRRGGDIDVQSEPGAGSAFTLKLPPAEPSPAP